MPLVSCSNCGKSFRHKKQLNAHWAHKLACRLARKREFQSRMATSGTSLPTQVIVPGSYDETYPPATTSTLGPTWNHPITHIPVVAHPAQTIANGSYPAPVSAALLAPMMTPVSVGMPVYAPTPAHAPSGPASLLVPTPHVPTPSIEHTPRPNPSMDSEIVSTYSQQQALNVNGRISNAPRKSTRKRYGYASVEEHPTAGRVLRYEPLAPESSQCSNRTAEKLSEEKELFELAEWLANMSCTDREREGYFKFEVHQHNLPWNSLKEMYQAIDKFEHGREFKHTMFNVGTQQGSEDQHVYARCALEITRDLIGNSDWKEHMSYAPRSEWVQTADERKIRVFDEMCTGEYWARMQSYLPEGALFIPVIVSTDPTRLSLLSGDKKASPVYFTIGNIDKSIRNRPSERATVLLGYLPNPKLEFITDPRERRQMKWQVYHAAMRLMLDPLKRAGHEGIEVRCADGGVRRAYPVVSAQIGDWMEVCTAACSFHTRCPMCIDSYDERGELGEPAIFRTKHQTLQAILDAINQHTSDSKKLGLRPIWPYWADLPYANGAQLIVPDLLHQIHKGMFKTHLFEWWKNIHGDEEIDRRIKGLPRFHGLRHFTHGISVISQWTGNEAKQLERTFLAVVADGKPKGALRATRALMEFFFRAHLPQIDEDDLHQMDVDLQTFHKNKEVFRRCGAYTSKYGWNGLSKLHMLRHFTHQIREMGATDGYTTETTERLHKYYVKNPYRQTSKAQNTTEEMLIRFQREEAWDIARARLERAGKIPKLKLRECVGDVGDFGDGEMTVEGEYEVPVERTVEETRPRHYPQLDVRIKEGLVIQPTPSLDIAKRPTMGGMRLAQVAAAHQAPGLWAALQDYVNTIDPDLNVQLNEAMTIGVWSFCKLLHDPLPFAPLVGSLTDFVRAAPAKIHESGRITRESNYDTVLVETYPTRKGIYKYRVGRVRVIFQLPHYAQRVIREPLAYVELFERFGPQLRPSEFFFTRPDCEGISWNCEVIPLSRVRMACHLVPKYSDDNEKKPLSATDDLLSTFPSFYLNHYSSYYFWSLFDHWARLGAN